MNGEDLKEKQNKAGHPLFILIIFVVLIGFIFYVPDIYKKYNKEINDFFGIKDEDEKEKDKLDEITPMSAYHQLNSNDSFDYNEISISEVSLSPEKKLTLTVGTNSTFDLDKSGYYIEFYQHQKTFIGRRALHGMVTKSLPIEMDISNLNVDTTTYYVITHISDGAIGGSNAENDKGLYSMTCTKNDESYTYEFYTKKLTKIKYRYYYANPNLDEYADELLKAQKKEKEYTEIGGITTSIAENTDSFIFTSVFDYSVKDAYEKIKNPNIFAKGTFNNVVKFKIEAEGYECR